MCVCHWCSLLKSHISSVAIFVAVRTRGYLKPVSESDRTVSDALGDPGSAGDQVDATVDAGQTGDLQKAVHDKADVLVARSTVSGVYAIAFHV